MTDPKNNGKTKELKPFGFDIIKALHNRNMYLVLQLIFKYLNGENLMNAELTSKTWKAAISNANLSVFWKIQFQQKLVNSPLWSKLHFNLAPSFDLALKDSLYSFRLFKKLQYTVETVTKNWTGCHSTKNFRHCEADKRNWLLTCGIVITEKYISIPFKDFQFTIFNRHTLKIIEEIHIPEEQRFLYHSGCALFEDAFIHVQNGQEIIIRHLISKKTEIFKPQIAGDNYISRLFAENGFLVAGISLKSGEFNRECHSTIIWKLKSPFEIEWENFETVPLVRFTDVFMDQKFLIFAHFNHRSMKLEYLIRPMSELHTQGKRFDFPYRCNVKYHDGFLIWSSHFSESFTTISKFDVQSGVTETVNLAISCNRNFKISIDSGFLLIYHHYKEKSRWTTKLKAWDLKTIMDPPSGSRIVQPVFDVSVCPFPYLRLSNAFHSLHSDTEDAFKYHVDMFGVVYVNQIEEVKNKKKFCCCQCTYRVQKSQASPLDASQQVVEEGKTVALFEAYI